MHAGIPCIFRFIYNNKNFFAKCCIVGCSIQNICAITTQIESSVCKLVEQKMIYVTKILCIISLCNQILFEEAVSKSTFILILLYLRIHMLMHYLTLSF